MEIDKINALKQYNGGFDANISLSTQSKTDILWWINNIDLVFKSLIPLPIDIVIYTDATKVGWGANLGIHRINGRWDETEAELHINILERMAVEIAILAFCKNEHKKHVRLMIDNMTAVSYLQNMIWVASNPQNATNYLEISGNRQRFGKCDFQQHIFQVQKTVLQMPILENSMMTLSGWFQISFSKS